MLPEINAEQLDIAIEQSVQAGSELEEKVQQLYPELYPVGVDIDNTIICSTPDGKSDKFIISTKSNYKTVKSIEIAVDNLSELLGFTLDTTRPAGHYAALLDNQLLMLFYQRQLDKDMKENDAERLRESMRRTTESLLALQEMLNPKK